MSERTCEVEGCGKKHRALGLCTTHYAESWYAERGGRVARVSDALPEDDVRLAGAPVSAGSVLGWIFAAVALAVCGVAAVVFVRSRSSPSA